MHKCTHSKLKCTKETRTINITHYTLKHVWLELTLIPGSLVYEPDVLPAWPQRFTLVRTSIELHIQIDCLIHCSIYIAQSPRIQRRSKAGTFSALTMIATLLY